MKLEGGEMTKEDFEELSGRNCIIEEDNSDEETTGSTVDQSPSTPRQPLVIVLARHQTREQVEASLLEASDILAEKRHLIDGVRILIEGFEQSSLHPSQLKPAKLKYAEAIEWGLLGFLMINGFNEMAQQVYLTAHAFAQAKGGGRIRFKRIDYDHMNKTGVSSGQAYLTLLSTHRSVDALSKLIHAKETTSE